MRFVFETENINQRLYKRAIRYLVYHMMKGSIRFHLFDDVIIKIRPMNMASWDRYFTKDGIGGYFGEKELVLYVMDQSGDLQFRTNMAMIGIETAHMILAKIGLRHRVKLRHNDEGGNKSGTILPFYVAEVHDRVHEGKLVTVKFWFWDWVIPFARKYKFRAIDIKDIV